MKVRGNFAFAILFVLAISAIIAGGIARFLIGKNVTAAFIVFALLLAGMGGFLVGVPLANRLFAPFFPPLFLTRMASRPPPKKAFNPDANLGDMILLTLMGILASVGTPYLIHFLVTGW